MVIRTVSAGDDVSSRVTVEAVLGGAAWSVQKRDGGIAYTYSCTPHSYYCEGGWDGL
jgi:hypothetical protein